MKRRVAGISERDVMKLPRRNFLHLAAGAAVLPAVSRNTWAQAYPTRPVRIVVGFTVGGFYDTYARLIAQWLSQHLGQPFVIENRTGAGGSIATEAVVRAAPDGYTLLFTGSNDAWNTALYDNLSFNYVRDIAPVASFSKGMGVLVVPPSFPARTVHEFIAYARDNPAKVTIASDGVGSGPHVFWELFRSMTGLNTLHVPYRGATPVIVDLLSAQVQAYFGYLAPLIEYVRRGRLRPLAVTAATRAEALPDVPTIAEFIPGYDATGWNGIGAPRGTPAEIIEKLNKAVNAGLADPRIKLRIAEFGDTVFASSPEEFGKHIVEFTDKWSKVIRAANIKQPELPIIGLIDVRGNAAGPTIAAFQKGLAEAGYVEGQNLTIDYRPMANEERLPELAAELIRRRVAVMVTLGSTPAALAAKVATTAIPVVFGVADDPVQIGLVASLNRPGGNVTGVTVVGSELGPKKLELLHEVSPTTKKIAVLVNPSNRVTSDADIGGARAAAQRLGLEIIVVNAGTDNEIESAFSSAVQRGTGAVYVGSDAFLTSRREQIAKLALRHKLLTMSSERAAVRAGQLMSYGAIDVDMYRQVGVYVGRLLKGEKAADLPVVQPTKFDLVINLTTAKALGLEVPPTLLARADEVIE
jgi:tripartite-type tricarboxylate transporter receptor subunit TctC